MSKTMDPMYEAQGELLREVATLKATLALKEEALAGSEAARERLVEALRPAIGTHGDPCLGNCNVRSVGLDALAAHAQPSQALQSRLDEEHSRATAAALAVIEGRANYEPIAQALAERIEREFQTRLRGVIPCTQVELDALRLQTWDAAVEACAMDSRSGNALRALLGKGPTP